jgi:hypothetical protein
MNKSKAKRRPETTECQISYAFEEFKKFMERHLVEGDHEVQLFLDEKRNCYAIFCTVCDPQMIGLGETRH